MTWNSILRPPPSPAATAQELVRRGGTFPPDLVLRGMLDPQWAYTVSAHLQEMERRRITDPSARDPVEDAAKVDLVQEWWESDTLLSLGGVSADRDGSQSEWRDYGAARRAYERYWTQAAYLDPQETEDRSVEGSDSRCSGAGAQSATNSPEALGEAASEVVRVLAMLLFLTALFGEA